MMSRRFSFGVLVLGAALCGDAVAVDVKLVGLFPNRAVVQIDGGPLQTMSIGQKTAEGVVLLSVENDGATFEIDGRRTALGLTHARMKPSAGAASVKVTADENGHFTTLGQVNGVPVRFAVDTGATFIAFHANEARRLGLDHGERGARVRRVVRRERAGDP